MKRAWLTRWTGLTAAMVVGAGLLLAVSDQAGAVTVSGTLSARSVGSKYAGSTETLSGQVTSLVTRTGAPGKPSKFQLLVNNTGTTSATYLIQLAPAGVDQSAQFLNHNIDITAVALMDGYATPDIAPGKSLALTLNVTPDVGASPDSFAGYNVIMLTADGSTQLAAAQLIVALTETKGTTAHDMFIKTAGQKEIRGADTLSGIGTGISSKTVNTGGKATFTLKLQNNSAAPAAVALQMFESDHCDNFVETVKRGNTDVSADVFGLGYTTPVLAPKKSLVLTVSLVNQGVWRDTCDTGNWAILTAFTSGTDGSEFAYLVTNSV